MLSLSGFHHESVNVDGETLRLNIRRFTNEQFAAFQKRRDEVQRGERRIAVLLKRFETDADKTVVEDKEAGTTTLVSDIQTTLARLELDAPEQYASLQAERTKLDALAFEFYRDSLKAYVIVPEGQIPGTAGDCDGLCLLDTFAGRQDIEQQVMGRVYGCNTMTPRQKKAFLLLLGSEPSSSEPTATPHGDEPATTAAPVDASSSASPEAATASTADAPSGTTPA